MNKDTCKQDIQSQRPRYGPLVRYVKLPIEHAPGMLGKFALPPLVSDPDIHHGTCVTHKNLHIGIKPHHLPLPLNCYCNDDEVGVHLGECNVARVSN